MLLCFRPSSRLTTPQVPFQRLVASPWCFALPIPSFYCCFYSFITWFVPLLVAEYGILFYGVGKRYLIEAEAWFVAVFANRPGTFRAL